MNLQAQIDYIQKAVTRDPSPTNRAILQSLLDYKQYYHPGNNTTVIAMPLNEYKQFLEFQKFQEFKNIKQ